MKRVGIYAGTFDPIHEGHIAFATEALKRCQLDKVFFLVEPRPRRKQGVKALEHRIHMVQLAVAKEARLGTIVLEQARFTVAETLPLLLARFKNAELQLLMGEDVLAHLVHWPHAKELVQQVGIIAGLRKHTAEEIKQQVALMKSLRGLEVRYQVFQAKFSAYSSSKIRLSLRHGRIPAGLPPGVTDYIRKHRLYAADVEV